MSFCDFWHENRHSGTGLKLECMVPSVLNENRHGKFTFQFSIYHLITLIHTYFFFFHIFLQIFYRKGHTIILETQHKNSKKK